jgi:hypothetical protein
MASEDAMRIGTIKVLAGASIVVVPGATLRRTIVSERKFLNKKIVKAFVDDLGDGHFFSIVYEKRDGELRRAIGRLGVTKHLKGGEATYNGSDGKAGNISYFDTEAQEYRCFNQERVLSLKGNGMLLEACDVSDLPDPIVNARGEEVVKK